MSTLAHPGIFTRWGHALGHKRVKESRERTTRVVSQADAIEAKASERVDRIAAASTRVEQAAVELLEKRAQLYVLAARHRT